jgi:opacity protein-like surface antigen
MKNLLKISLWVMLLGGALQASAQYYPYRPYPYGRPYDNPYRQLQRNMEHNGDQNQYAYRSRGDSKFVLGLNYGITMPVGSLHDYTSKTSFNGWNISLLYQINAKLAAGLGIGFYDYYQKFPRQVYQDKTTSISAVQSRTLQLIPIEPTIVFTPGGDSARIQPYVGLGIGAANVNYEKYWGEFVDKDNQFSFIVSPMAGIRIPFSPTSPVTASIGVKYNYAPYSYNEISGLSTIEGNVGLSIRLR